MGSQGGLWDNGDDGLTARMNRKGVFHGSGSEISALDPVTPTSRYAFAGNGNDSVGANNLTANGTPTYGTDGGVYGQYTILNGSSQYFTAANNTVFDVTTGDFSIWGFIYRTSDSGTEEAICNKYDGTTGYLIYIQSTSDQLRLFVKTGGVTVEASTTSTISLNTWYFFAASADRDGNGVIHLYNMSNGAYETGSNSIVGVAGSLTNTNTFTVGRASSASQWFFPGRIDHLNVLLGTAITSAQVEDIISNLHGGQLAVCHGTGSGFTTDIVYQRNEENTAWNELVELTTSQTITNKTVNATNNTITDTSTAAEDLFRSNGTKFVRFAKGSNFNFLRVNGSGALEYDEIYGNELGRTQLGAAGTTLTLSSLTSKKHMWFLAFVETNATNTGISIDVRFNNDSGANYYYRESTSGGADTTTSGDTEIDVGALVGGSVGEKSGMWLLIEVENESTSIRKVGYMRWVSNPSGAGIPARQELAFQWANTSAQINRIDIISSVDMGTTSRVIAFGMD